MPLGCGEYIDGDEQMVKHPVKTGLAFGLTSGIITTLGLMVGLHSGTHSRLAVVGGILTIAIADALSDAMGIHISEESEARHTLKEVWEATASTFLSKFAFASTFLLPALTLELPTAIAVSVIWGLLLLGVFSYYIAREQKAKFWKIAAEHLLIALAVVFIAHYIGGWIRLTLG